LSKRPITHWTIHELNKIVAKKFEAAAKCQPGPKRQKLLREAKRYKTWGAEQPAVILSRFKPAVAGM
jgi:hypothetical protein